MSRETLERELVVDADTPDVWEKILEVQRVAAWLPFLHTVTEKVPLSSYVGILEDKVGPFSLKADLLITVVELEECKLIAVKASGEDRQVRSRITIDASMKLRSREDGSTELKISGTYEVTGKVATLGARVIRTKARKMVDEFCISAAAGLA